MNTTLLVIGLICLIAAVVGGGLEMAGAKVPVLDSPARQVALGVVGFIGIVLAFVASRSSANSVPGNATPPAPTVIASSAMPTTPAPDPSTSSETDRLTTAPPSTPTTQSDVPTSYYGRWRGQLVQPDSPQFPKYTAEIDIRGGIVGDTVADTKYPLLKCAGELTLQNSLPVELQLEESLTLNDNNECADHLGIRIIRKSATSIEIRVYTSTTALEGVPEAHGILTRVP